MSIESIVAGIAERAAGVAPLGKNLKFDFGDENIVYIDGSGDANEVHQEDNEADCVVKISPENFNALVKGDLNPMMAMMSGKIKIKGDMGLAMKLQSLLG